MHSARTQKHHVILRGFTIIELMVTVGIVALLSAVIIFQYSKFDSQLLLRNIAYEVAGAIREVQVYGVSVVGSSGDFQASYGVHFTKGKTYISFKDNDGDGAYSSGDTTLATYTVGGRNNSITSLCTKRFAYVCDTNASIDLLFKRPDPDAKFALDGVRDDTAMVPLSYIEILLGSSAGSTRKVVVYSTGQVSIK